MGNKREFHLEQEENQAKQHLEHMTRRWPTDPKVMFALLVVALLLILLLWL